MNGVYKRINPGLTTSGEQYLYYMLRTPTVDKEEYGKRSRLVDLVQDDEPFRLKLQVILSKLGRSRRADICRAFDPKRDVPNLLPIYLLLSAALIASLICLPFTFDSIRYTMVLFVVNSLVHSLAKSKIDRDLDTLNYSVSMVYSAKKVQKLGVPVLDEVLQPMYSALEKLRGVLRVGAVSTGSSNPLAEMLNMVLLLDLITYEYPKNKLSRCHNEIFTIHEHLGMLDSAIAVASYRKSIGEYAIPNISFSDGGDPYYKAANLRHPLINDPVPNSVGMDRSVLLTGSNASGKSTFLKSAAVNAILAQSICTALSDSYEASAFYIFSSIAISDDLFAGESYYIAEIKSLKRIIDFPRGGKLIFCVIDEVLRGTNTVERIAASSEILSFLAESSILCVAATHDAELCGILSDKYTMLHFEERIEGGEIYFDYKLKDGAATSRNAIKLLGMIGLDEGLVSNAENRAEKFELSGKWEQ